MSVKSSILDRLFAYIVKHGHTQSALRRLHTNATTPPLHFLPRIIPTNAEMIFIDVGANIGQTIDEVLQWYPRAEIWSFEPTPDLVAQLHRQYDSIPQVHIVGSALGNCTGSIPFHVSSFPATNSALNPDIAMYEAFGSSLVDDFRKMKTIDVPVDRLDAWHASMLKKPIDVLKIDTQGFEFQVLEGATGILRDQVRSIMLETQYLPFYENAVPFYRIFEFLYDHGFYLVDFFNILKSDSMQILESDVLFLNRNEFPYTR